jgi:endonuclease/exonuclease/phosphatase family metal-dependent hydrolase
MKNSYPLVIAFGLFFLFFIQMTGILVESIYILDLMNTSLDAKALGILFFFSPVLLLPFRKKFPTWAIWLFFGLLFFSRGLTPYLNTTGRFYASGIGVGTALLLFPLLVTSKPKAELQPQTGLWISAGLALAVGLSALFRTLNYSLDLSLSPGGGWIGWGLGLLFGWTLTQLNWDDERATPHSNGRVVSAVLGIFLALALTYFAFSAPAVIARWTQGNYVLIVTAVSLLAVGWIFVALSKPALIERLSLRGLLTWNLLFTLSLAGTILAHRVSFPLTPDSPAVVVGAPGWLQQVLLALMLLLFPVIFLDVRLFFNTIQQENVSPRALIPGMLIGSTALVVLVFMHIFTNVWGYVAPVSTIFRNQFYLPYLLIAGSLTLLVWRQKPVAARPASGPGGRVSVGWMILLGVIVLVTGVSALRSEKVQTWDVNKKSIVVMTYNIQEANDGFAERAYDRQLAMIQKVSPDILALQESDSARISLNNNDYVRYFAAKLGYYAYYGPTTVTGTFGTAILSKYPLTNPRTSFTFSDSDEIGTAEAEVKVGGRLFTIYDVHPDGSDTAKLVLARSVLERSHGKDNVIILGDYNLRDYEDAFQLIAAVYTNAWTSVYPSKIGADGTDMSGKNRIDHIFFSPALRVRNPMYVLPPASATDHPVHWTEIYWEE